jgi:hypothetical protein
VHRTALLGWCIVVIQTYQSSVSFLLKTEEERHGELHRISSHARAILVYLGSGSRLRPQPALDHRSLARDRPTTGIEVRLLPLLAHSGIHAVDFDGDLLTKDLLQFLIRQWCLAKEINPAQIAASGSWTHVYTLEFGLL